MIPQRTPVLFLIRCVLQTAGKTLLTEIYESYLLILQVGKLVPRDRKEIYNLNQRLEQVLGLRSGSTWISVPQDALGCPRMPQDAAPFYTPHKLVSVSC